MKTSTLVWIGVGTIAAVGIGFLIYNNVKNSATETTLPDATKPPEKVTVPNNTPIVTVAAPTPPTLSGKSVASALLNTDPKNLFGKKVYVNTDNTNIYTNDSKLYTKARKGQLIGTFAFNKPLTAGGSIVTIQSNDPQNKWLIAGDKFLNF